MHIALWIVQGLLSLVYLMAGGMKLRTSRQAMLEQGQMGWVEDFSETQVRLIGTAEVLGALGLVLPGITGIYPQLTAWAATGLALLMASATYTHLRRKERPVTVVLMLMAAFIAYGRFVLAPL